jgi:phage gpG-like protein
MAFEVTAQKINFDKLGAQLQQLKTLEQRGALAVGLEQVGNAVQGYAQDNIRAQGLIDTGALVNSVTVQKKNYHEVWVFSNMIYAAIHEFGGTIVPVKAKFLAIPLGDVEKNVGSPSNWPGELHFVPVLGPGNAGGYLMDAQGNLHYRLVKKVTIAAKPWMAPAVTEHLPEIQTLFETIVLQEIQKILGAS